MKDTQLYEQLLGLSKPWSVDRVDLDFAGQAKMLRDAGAFAHMHRLADTEHHVAFCGFRLAVVPAARQLLDLAKAFNWSWLEHSQPIGAAPKA